jgi:signal transduction histidine kinase
VGAEPVSILLVDDRPENLVTMEAVLGQPGRQLLKATSGNEALRLLLKQEVAVALLDVQMPGMDGFEIARLMRGQARTRDVPIIFVTAGDRSDAAFEGYEAGAVDFLHKPISPAILKSKVDVFIRLYVTAREQRALVAQLERTGAALRLRVADLESVNRTLSHDLRAPLRSIEGFSRILVEEVGPKLDDQCRGHLDRIIRASARMHRMLDDLYRLLHISSAEESFAPTDASAVMDGVVEDLRADIVAAGAAVTHGTLPTVPANATLLALVLQNLIANALKFRRSDAAPAVRVDAARDGDGWRFSVADNGVGIEPASREKIFEVFQRLASDAVPGTGVGLALCKQSVEKHGGSIWVESEPGRGSTFYFTLPASREGSHSPRADRS